MAGQAVRGGQCEKFHIVRGSEAPWRVNSAPPPRETRTFWNLKKKVSSIILIVTNQWLSLVVIRNSKKKYSIILHKPYSAMCRLFLCFWLLKLNLSYFHPMGHSRRHPWSDKFYCKAFRSKLAKLEFSSCRKTNTWIFRITNSIFGLLIQFFNHTTAVLQNLGCIKFKKIQNKWIRYISNHPWKNLKKIDIDRAIKIVNVET